MAKTIIRKKGDFRDLNFEVDLTDYGKTLADVSEIFFSVKCDENDADDLLLLKQMTTADIDATGTNILDVNVHFAPSDYVNFQVDKEYKAGLFLKFTGDPAADENTDDLYIFKIKEDFLKQN